MTSLAVIGGGITGLAAARQGVSLGCDVTVFEASDRWGGCIDTTPLAGHDIDVGPDAFLCREASAVALCDELGLTLTSPAASSAGVLRHGMLRQIPRGTLLGIPGDPMVLRKAGMVGWAGALRASIEPWLPLRPLRADTDIASFVKHRIGASVFNATVGPLVGSIHAGRADDLSVRAVIPGLVSISQHHKSLRRAAQLHQVQDGPAFARPVDGMVSIANALVASLQNDATLVCSSPVRCVSALNGSWRVDDEKFDAAVIAVPAHIALGMLDRPIGELAEIRTAGVSMVLVAYAAAEVAFAPDHSGFLVAPDQPGIMTAASFMSNKWPGIGDESLFITRISAGRAGDERHLTMPDSALTAHLLAEFAAATGVTATPLDTAVRRWPDAFAQYRPGHLELVAALRAALPQRLAVAGASYDGIGIPACIRSGAHAAASALQSFAPTSKPSPRG